MTRDRQRSRTGRHRPPNRATTAANGLDAPTHTGTVHHFSFEVDEHVRISPTLLRQSQLCPLQVWFAARNPSETAAPTLGLAIGQIAHAVMAQVSAVELERLRLVNSEEDVWNTRVADAVRQVIDDAFQRHFFIGAFGERARTAREEWTAKLVSLVQSRAERARSMWRAGQRGEDLAYACAPMGTEVEWFDPELRMHGFCDEVWKVASHHRPVELKTGPHTPIHQRANRSQAAAYGYLASVVGGLRVTDCEVLYLQDGFRDNFRFGESWRRAVRREAKRVGEIIVNPVQPRATPAREVCSWCPFQQICSESKAPSIDEAMSAVMERSVPPSGER